MEFLDGCTQCIVYTAGAAETMDDTFILNRHN